MLFKILTKTLILATIIQLPCMAMELLQETTKHNQIASNIIGKARSSIEKYIDFQKDHEAYARKSTNCDWQSNLNEISNNICELSRHIEFLDTPNNTINDLLQHFLRSRLKNIKTYDQSFKAGKYNRNNRSEQMREKIKAFVKVCNFYDELTADIFHMIPTNLLTQETIDLISISHTLWPLLKCETKVFSDPEQAKIIDLILFKVYVEQSQSIIKDPLGDSESETETKVTLYEKFNYQNNILKCSNNFIPKIKPPRWLVDLLTRSSAPHNDLRSHDARPSHTSSSRGSTETW